MTFHPFLPLARGTLARAAALPPTHYPLSRAFHVEIDHGCSSDQFAESTLELAIARVIRAVSYPPRAFSRGRRVTITECVAACEACDRYGSKQGRDGRYRKCRACGGTPFRYEFVLQTVFTGGIK